MPRWGQFSFKCLHGICKLCFGSDHKPWKRILFFHVSQCCIFSIFLPCPPNTSLKRQLMSCITIYFPRRQEFSFWSPANIKTPTFFIDVSLRIYFLIFYNNQQVSKVVYSKNKITTITITKEQHIKVDSKIVISIITKLCWVSKQL